LFYFAIVVVFRQFLLVFVDYLAHTVLILKITTVDFQKL